MVQQREPVAPRRSPASCGGLLRNFHRFVKGCFSLFLENRFAFEAALFGFMIVTEPTNKFEWNSLWVETKSLHMVLILKTNSSKVLWRFENRQVIALYTARTLNMSLSHLSKKTCVTDELASFSIISEEENWWFQALNVIQHLIYRDLIRLQFYKFWNK